MGQTRITCKLKQYTPLLHFQGDQSGACLRATEVKPELDRFITGYLHSKGWNAPEEWVLSDYANHRAYRYKLHLTGTSKIIDCERSEKGKPKNEWEIVNKLRIDKNENVKALISMDTQLFILCSVTKTLPLDDGELSLSELIQTLLPPFFALHCFGLRSSKGFGSFAVEGAELTDLQSLSAWLPEPDSALYAPYTKRLFYGDYGRSAPRPFHYLNDVVTLNALMKGGLNFGTAFIRGYIRKYPELPGRSEKAFIKRDILPNRREDEAVRRAHENYRPATATEPVSFKRAVLGLAPVYEYRKHPEKEIYRNEKLQVDAEDEQLERFANPVRFKPHGRYLLMIPQPIPKKLLGASFKFAHEREAAAKLKYAEISTPAIQTPERFELDDFLRRFTHWYNVREDPEFDSVMDFRRGGFDFANTFGRLKTIQFTEEEAHT